MVVKFELMLKFKFTTAKLPLTFNRFIWAGLSSVKPILNEKSSLRLTHLLPFPPFRVASSVLAHR